MCVSSAKRKMLYIQRSLAKVNNLFILLPKKITLNKHEYMALNMSMIKDIAHLDVDYCI